MVGLGVIEWSKVVLGGFRWYWMVYVVLGGIGWSEVVLGGLGIPRWYTAV